MPLLSETLGTAIDAVSETAAAVSAKTLGVELKSIGVKVKSLDQRFGALGEKRKKLEEEIGNLAIVVGEAAGQDGLCGACSEAVFESLPQTAREVLPRLGPGAGDDLLGHDQPTLEACGLCDGEGVVQDGLCAPCFEETFGRPPQTTRDAPPLLGSEATFRLCPRGHPWKFRRHPRQAYACDTCGNRIKITMNNIDAEFYDCRKCDYSMCTGCHGKLARTS